MMSRSGDRFRAVVLTVSAAVWGMGVAVAAMPLLRRPAPPGQLPGWATANGIDAAGPFRATLLLIALPFLFALAGPFLARLFDPARAERWAYVTAIAGLLGGAWLTRIPATLLETALIPAAIVLVAAILRGFDARFSRRDVLLIPTIFPVYFALLDLTPKELTILPVAVLLVLATRLAAARITTEPSQAFALAPLAMVFQSIYVDSATRHSGWPPLLFALLSPLVLAALFRGQGERMQRIVRRVVGWAIFPLAILLYLGTLWNPGGQTAHSIDFFEHGHSLTPASEMMRGELPFRDFVPGHGLGEDGLVDLVAMKVKGETAGDILEARLLFSTFNAVAIYAAATAATGSPELGYLSALLATTMIGSGPTFTRSVFAYLAIAFLVAAIRRRDRRLFAGAGVMTAAQILHSIDFGFFTLVTLTVSIFLASRSWRGRGVASLWSAAGLAVVGIPVAIVFGAFGILDDFLRVTLLETPPLAAAYTTGFPDLTGVVPKPWSFPEVLGALLQNSALPLLAWPLIVVATATIVPFATRRTAPLIVIGSFIAIVALSYAERKHIYFVHALPIFLVVAAALLWRAARPWSIALITVIAIAANVTPHLGLVTMLRTAEKPLDPTRVDLWESPRARHALFTADDAQRFRFIRDWMNANLRPDETFFDFSDMSLLYFLMNRDMPVRQYEVAFYETPELQQEVIRRLETNPKVRAAVISFNGFAVDGISGPTRAPMVWKYLQARFRPAYENNGIVIWIRK
jgi:hypothetical protein